MVRKSRHFQLSDKIRIPYCSTLSRYKFFINLLNKTESYLALFLPFLIFCFGVTVLFLFIYFSLALFLYQNQFSSYTSNETSFLVSLHCLSGKSSLNYSVSRRFSLLTYIQSFTCTSCIWNKILLI